MIYLASSSPRRKALLRKLRVPFRVVRSRYREGFARGKSPVAAALCHAIGKARRAVVRSRCGRVLGADTLIYFKGRIIGKPKSYAEAYRMLKSFSGRSHGVYTAVALIDLKTGRLKTGWDQTRVTFNRLDDRTIRRYLARVNPLDKAGAYAIQRGKALVRSIRGSFTNVMGLPVELLRKKFSISRWRRGLPARGRRL